MSRPDTIGGNPTIQWTRRGFLQVGYSGLLGVSLPGLLTSAGRGRLPGRLGGKRRRFDPRRGAGSVGDRDLAQRGDRSTRLV